HGSRLAEEEGKEPDPRFQQPLMVTIAGVAAGIRNTGCCFLRGGDYGYG
ncbi:phosphoenolpyruvate carboxylase, partial [Enterobacter intestinihominis]